jgi:hypothetical protein
MTVALSVCVGARRPRRDAHPRIEGIRNGAIFKVLPGAQQAFFRIWPERLPADFGPSEGDEPRAAALLAWRTG